MNTKQQKIAFFDSGVGGLTVFKEFKKLLPKENYIYFGDLKNIPYGSKSKAELIKIADKIFRFLETKDVKAVLMACNTTSANTYEELKNNYNFKIYPIIQSCAKIIADLPLKKIGVFATEATVKSDAYGRELKKFKPDLDVFEISCPQWVKIVEEKLQDNPQSLAEVKFYIEKMLKNNPDKIVLGCTHYPYLLNILSKFAPKDLFIDPAPYFAEFVKSDLQAKGLINPNESGSEKFFVSANPEAFKTAGSMFYDLTQIPELVDVDNN